jgi:hypothetical protein
MTGGRDSTGEVTVTVGDMAWHGSHEEDKEGRVLITEQTESHNT